MSGTKNKFGQYFNIDGILLSFKYLFKLKLLKPNIYCRSLIDVDLDVLKKNNIKFIVFDKDNTLTLPHKTEFANKDIQNKVSEFKIKFGEENLCVVSNSAGSKDDKNNFEANLIEKTLQLKVLKHEYKKPRVSEEILAYYAKHQSSSEICVIGDRLLVDVILGIENNFYTILLDPITLTKDNFMVKAMRTVEKLILSHNKINYVKP
jgi:phosphatidylglycerophosphatase GEP4